MIDVMSLNVGGIYVAAPARVTRRQVVELITSYWLNLGARSHAGDPLQLEPLSLEKTGILGFAVAEPAEGPAEERWIAVYDSERYRADSALARHLAITLGVPVVHYEMAGATDYAYAKVYGDGGPELPRKLTWDEVEGFVAYNFPHPFLYFNKLKEAAKEELADFAFFAFEGIGPRPRAKYTGTARAVLEQEATKAAAAALAKRYDVAGVRALLTQAAYVESEVRDAVKYARQTEPAGLRFVLAFAQMCADDPWTNREVAEAAVRAGDDALFARAFAVEHQATSFALFEQSALTLYKEKNVAGALKILGAIVGRPSASLTAWNNWLAMLLQCPLPPYAELAERFMAAAQLAPKNPSMFHNLACLAQRYGDSEQALAHIRAAARYGYENLQALRDDETFETLRRDPRFDAALAPSGEFALDELEQRLIIHGQERVVMRPVLGMVFYCRAALPEIGPRIASAVERYIAMLPPGTLTHAKKGHWRALNKGTLTKDKNFLRKPPADAAYFTLSLRAGDGDAVDHAIEVEVWSGAATRVACTFPRTLAADDAVRRFAEIADILQFTSGMAGHTVAERDSCNVYEGVHWDSAPLYARCLGFAPRYRGHAMGREDAAVAHWLTFLAHPLVALLGGEAALAHAIGSAQLQRSEAGVCIRASAAAPIGVMTNPRDLGALPDVARALRALRPGSDEECTRQHARWDAVPATPWANNT